MMRSPLSVLVLLLPLIALPAAEPELFQVQARQERQVAKVVGSVASARATTIAARVSAAVVELPLALGDAVSAGQVLAQLEAEEIRARLASAQAQVALAEADLSRAERLVASGTATAANVDSVRAAAQSARAQLAEAETMLGYLTLRAPYDGVITVRHAEAGDLAQPGRALLEIADPAALRFEARVPESLAGALELGQVMGVAIQGRIYNGPIVEIAAAAEVASRSVLVKVDLPRAAEEEDTAHLRLGQFGRLWLFLDEETVLSVPESALIQRGQLQQVAVLEEGVVRLRLVRSGQRWMHQPVNNQPGSPMTADGPAIAMVNIVAGLKAGDQVILNAHALRDGQAWSGAAP